MPVDPLTLPADESAVAALAASGLRYAVVDPADDDAARAWTEADARGFHEPARSDEFQADVRGDFAINRTVGVYDDTLADPAVPVATVVSWPAALTVPGGEVTGWAISGVTVAPTHRRRGVARAMLEAELRAAVAAGLPLAMLTVSEATIYGRWGFGPAAFSAALAIDARRAGWQGAEAPGRVQFVSRDTALATARAVLDDARRGTPGDVEIVGHRYVRLFGLPSDPADLRGRRIVRYDDEQGVPRGVAVYTVKEDGPQFTDHAADVLLLAAATDDAYRALWSHVLTLDLVALVTAQLRSVDEPLRWLVRDQRAVRVTELREHLWLRVLDVPATLGARTYAGPGRLGLRVADPLGYAEGEWLLDVAEDGAAQVSSRAAPEGVPSLGLSVDLLGSLLLGGVSAATLAHAGRIAERAPGDALAADRLLRAPTTPVLSTWF